MPKSASSPNAAKPSSEHSGDLRVAGFAEGTQPQRGRSAEVYLGRWGSQAHPERDRVSWMAERAKGPRIFDIGCGEGVLTLSLARAGHQVLGIDTDPAAITAARDLLRSEPPAVRDRIELRVADALSAELDEDGFDTVVLGEVIEHLDDPSAMLERASDFLKAGARLVLTTPFGHSSHPDQRQEFRTTELVNLLTARFVIDDLSVFDGDFRVTAHLLSAPVLHERRAPDLHHLLVATEEAAVTSQKRLCAQMEHLHGQLALKKGLMQEALRRLAAAAEKERASADKIRRLRRQLEHQERITAATPARMHQAQVRLKQEQQDLRQELGRAVEKSLRSPLGVFRLPLRIAKAYRRARRRAEQRASPTAPEQPKDRLAAPTVGRTRRGSEPSARLPHLDLSAAFQDREIKVAICICTCNRPQMLEDVLMALREVELDGLHPKSVDVVVVDNDPSPETETVCQEAARKLPFPLHYVIEHRRGIAHARNCAVSEALAHGADFIAFIDDDDRPETDWLKHLLKKQSETEVEIVGGSWRMSESAAIPRWLQATPMARRLSRGGGTSSYGMPKGLATHNVLIARSILERLAGQGPVFALEFALIGGGDNDFFVRAFKAGASFAMAEDSYIIRGYEESRMTLRGMTKRAFRIGSADTVLAKKHASRKRMKRRLARAIKRLCVRLFTLPIVVFSTEKLGQTLWEVCYHAGALHSFLGGRYEYYRYDLADGGQDRRRIGPDDEVGAFGDRDRPFHVVAQGQARHAEPRRLLLDAAAVGQHDGRPFDQADHDEIGLRRHRK